MEERYLTARQAADLLQCGLSTVYEMAGLPGCPVLRIGKGNRGVRFPRAAFLDWLRERGDEGKEHLVRLGHELPPLRTARR